MENKNVLKIEMGNITIKAAMKGFWHGDGKEDLRLHNHAVFEFHTMMRGDAILETDQNPINLNEKDSVLIPPKAFHSFKKKEKGSAIISFTFFVERSKRGNGTNYAQIIEEKLKSAEQPIVFSRNSQIEEYLTKIVAGMYSKSSVAEDRTKALFVLLFTEIFSLLYDKESGIYEYGSDLAESDTRIFMISEYFNEHYMENISLKNLSERLYLSEKQTDKMIKKAFGEGFKQHLCRIRLLIAQKLLTNTDMEIREIAESVGYQSYNGFYLAFKDKIKTTPQEYRKHKNAAP